MKNFVLVHGAWHGGWCWKRVLPYLRAAGHETYAVTLTGVGERSHLISADIRLNTHIQDVLGLIENEELDNIVLVGHSYGGMVITGVADLLLQRDATRLQHLIYVDAVTPHPGESWSSRQSAQTVAARVKAAAESGGVSMPQADASAFGLDGPDRDWVNRRQTPHPFGVYQDPLMFDAQRVASVKRTFVDCTSPALQTIAVMRQRVRTEPGWQVVELKTGHDPMVSQPEELARLLLA
jgi:pimeloyl-ACP methyl ester carboxylesterase